MKKALDYVSDYQLKSACKDAICLAPSKVTQMIFAVLEDWYHHIVHTQSCKLVIFAVLLPKVGEWAWRMQKALSGSASLPFTFLRQSSIPPVGYRTLDVSTTSAAPTTLLLVIPGNQGWLCRLQLTSSNCQTLNSHLRQTQRSWWYLLYKPRYSPFCLKFCFHGNKGQSG